MMFDLIGQFPGFFTYGLLAAVLVGGGIVMGRALAGTRRAKNRPVRDDMERMMGGLTQVVDWTRHVADDMSEYRSVIAGVSNLFRNHNDPWNEGKRTATVELLSQLVNANEQLQNRLNQAESVLQEQAGDISQYMSEARTDPLTGLPNRRALDESLSQRLCEWSRHARPLSVLMIDIDHFKTFNDTYGHAVGDLVLRQVGDVLRTTTRESDIVGRFGGEEMVVVLPGTEMDEARVTAVRVLRAVTERAFGEPGASLQLTVSLGAAQCQDNESADGVLSRTDEALYAAKEAGRNRAFWHDGHRPRCVGREEDRDGRCAPDKVTGKQGADGNEVAEPESSQSSTSFNAVCAELRRRLETVTREFGENVPR